MYTLYIHKHTASMIMYHVRNFKWFSSVIMMTYSQKTLTSLDFCMHIVLKTRMGSEPDCRAQSEARSRNPSLVPGQRGWNDLPPRPPPPEERFCDLGGILTSAIGWSFQDLRCVLVDTAERMKLCVNFSCVLDVFGSCLFASLAVLSCPKWDLEGPIVAVSSSNILL